MTKPHPELQAKQISGYFRANVGILLVNPGGLVFASERMERPGAWQLPQGGIDQCEDESEAAKREIEEEIGLDRADIERLLEPLGTHDGWFGYQLPESAWSQKNGRGQVQRFYAFRFIGEDEALDEKFSTSQEFSNWRWMKMDDIIESAWAVRKPVYAAVAAAFDEYLA